MKRYIIHGEILSPVHIGTNDELEPFDYVIKDGVMVKFDLLKVLSHLSSEERAAFDRLNNGGSLVELRDFIAEVVAPETDGEYSCAVTAEIQRFYKEKLRDIRNQMIINPFIRTNGQPYIPGSSIKGAVRTSVVSGLANKDGTKNILNGKRRDKYFDKDFEKLVLGFRDVKQDPFKAVKFSDIQLKQENILVGDISNIPNLQKLGDKETDSGVDLHIEHTWGTVLDKPVQFQGELLIDDGLQRKGRDAVSRSITVDDILDACYRHYSEKHFEENVFVAENEKSGNIYNKIADIIEGLNNEDETIIRLGRFSGAPSVTADEFRQIPDRKINKFNYIKWNHPGASRFYSEGIYPMGWVKLKFEEIR